jgi:transcriptional antiterminator RfaH
VFWACAETESRRESFAETMLVNAGFQVYLPKILERRRVNSRKVPVPLFASYAFVLIIERWYDVRWCPGVVRLVMGGDVPARVPDKVILELRGRERGGFVVMPAPPTFRAGDRVRITRGAFAGQLAVFDGMRSHERVAVLLQILGRVELPKADIARG